MQCKECLNKFSTTALICSEYPKGIPEEILYDKEECEYIRKGENGVPQRVVRKKGIQ